VCGNDPRLPGTLLALPARSYELRAVGQPAWEKCAAASPLIDLQVAEGRNHPLLLGAPQECTAVISAWLVPHLQQWDRGRLGQRRMPRSLAWASVREMKLL
jgi:hypothetical protein